MKVPAMPAQKHPGELLPAAEAHLNDLLDEALEETFPASDPVAIDVELRSRRAPAGTHKKVRSTNRTHPPKRARKR